MLKVLEPEEELPKRVPLSYVSENSRLHYTTQVARKNVLRCLNIVETMLCSLLLVYAQTTPARNEERGVGDAKSRRILESDMRVDEQYSGSLGPMVMSFKEANYDEVKLSDALTELNETNPCVAKCRTVFERTGAEGFLEDHRNYVDLDSLENTNIERFQGETEEVYPTGRRTHRGEIREGGRSVREGVQGILLPVMDDTHHLDSISLNQVAAGKIVDRDGLEGVLYWDDDVEGHMFPALFPDGCGTYHDMVKKGYAGFASPKEYVKWRLNNADKRWRNNPIWCSFWFDHLEKIDLHKNVGSLLSKNIDPKNMTSEDIEMKIRGNVDLFTRKIRNPVRGSPLYWRRKLNDLQRIIQEHGNPSYFVTLTINDSDKNLLEHLEGKDPSTHPVETAQYFKNKVDVFKEIYLNGEPGLFECVKVHYIRYEIQARGALHAHILLWSKNRKHWDNSSESDKDACFKTAEVSVHPTGCVNDRGVTRRERRAADDYQYHACERNPKCMKLGRCRYGSPWPLCESYEREIEEGRTEHIYKRLEERDRSAPSFFHELVYLWDGHINVQYCDDSLLSAYLSKYETKSEMSGVVDLDLFENVQILREENCEAEVAMKRQIACRLVSLEEMCFRLLGNDYVDSSVDVEYVAVCHPMEENYFLKCVEKAKDDHEVKAYACASKVDAYLKRQEKRSCDDGGSSELKENVPYLKWRETHNEKGKRKIKPSLTRTRQILPYDIEDYSYYLILKHDENLKADTLNPYFDRGTLFPVFDAIKERGVINQAFEAYGNDEDTERMEEMLGEFTCDKRILLELWKLQYKKESANIYTPERILTFIEKVEEQFGQLWEENENNRNNITVKISMEQYLDAINPSEEKTTFFVPFDDGVTVNATGTSDLNVETHLVVKDDVHEHLRSLNYEQLLLVFEILLAIQFKKESKVIFCNALGGVGKSYISNVLSKILEARDLKATFLGPTGIAAASIGGQTLHSMMQVNYRNPGQRIIVNQDSESAYNLRTSSLIIVDEISMVSAEMLYRLDLYLRQLCGNEKEAFGGKNIVFFGDLLQLPTIKNGVHKQNDVYASISWNYLESNYRTIFTSRRHMKCPKLSGFLKDLRKSALLPEDISKFMNLLGEREIKSVLEVDSNLAEYTFICGEHEKAQKHNEFVLNNDELFQDSESNPCHSSIAEVFDVRSKKEVKNGQLYAEVDKRDHDSVSKLSLRKGAKMLLTKSLGTGANKIPKGTFVTVQNIKFFDVLGEQEPCSLEIRFKRNDEKEITKTIKKQLMNVVYVNGKVYRKKQFPLLPAYGVTVHRIQGCTFEKIIVLLDGAMRNPGQAYVALSRGTMWRNLYVMNMSKEAFVSNINALKVMYKCIQKSLPRYVKLEPILKNLVEQQEVHNLLIEAEREIENRIESISEMLHCEGENLRENILSYEIQYMENGL